MNTTTVQNVEVVKLQTNAGFGFSMTGTKKLNEMTYTLALILLDTTGSVSGEESEIKRMLEQIVADGKSAGWGKRVLLAAYEFNTIVGVREIFGFDLPLALDLSNINIRTNGATNLIDAIGVCLDILEQAGTTMVSADYIINLLLPCVTDGEDNASSMSAAELRTKSERLRKHEKFDSLKTILIGLRTAQRAQDSRYSGKTVEEVLRQLAQDANFDQYESAAQVKDGTYGRIGGFISQSVSSASQSLGSGSPSQNVSFTV